MRALSRSIFHKFRISQPHSVLEKASNSSPLGKIEEKEPINLTELL